MAYNRIILEGYLGRDPELTYYGEGKPVVRNSLGVARVYGKGDETDWFELSFFDKLAEVAGQHTRKGSRLLVEGYVRVNKVVLAEGSDEVTRLGTVPRIYSNVVVTSMQFLSQKDSGQQPTRTQAASSPAARADDDVPF